MGFQLSLVMFLSCLSSHRAWFFLLAQYDVRERNNINYNSITIQFIYLDYLIAMAVHEKKKKQKGLYLKSKDRIYVCWISNKFSFVKKAG